jgi:hypothetical protein
MSGVVSGYHDQERFPRLCYNSACHISLGWFNNRMLDITGPSPTISSATTAWVNTGPVRVAAFVDYATIEQQYATSSINPPPQYYWNIVVRINSFVSLQYNKAKLHNSDVYENGDHVVIVDDRGVDATYFIAALRPCTTADAASVCIYDSPDTGRIEVCGYGRTDETGIDFAIVSLSEYNGLSYCHVNPVPELPVAVERYQVEGTSPSTSTDAPVTTLAVQQHSTTSTTNTERIIASNDCIVPPEDLLEWLSWLTRVLSGEIQPCD